MLSGGKPNYDMLDIYLSRKVTETFLLKSGIDLASIRIMSDREALEYATILAAFNEQEAKQLERNQ